MTALWFLFAFLLLSAFDGFYFHVYKEDLGTHAAFQRERSLHVQGNVISAALAMAVAWLEWHGWTLLLPLALLAGEIALSVLDYFEEKRVRNPHPAEKALHWSMLCVHTAFALLALPAALLWWSAPTELIPTTGLQSAALTAASLALLAAAAVEARQTEKRR